MRFTLFGQSVTLSCTFKCHPTRPVSDTLILGYTGNMVNVPCLSLALPAFTSQVVNSLQRSGGMYHPVVVVPGSLPCRSTCAWHVGRGWMFLSALGVFCVHPSHLSSSILTGRRLHVIQSLLCEGFSVCLFLIRDEPLCGLVL